MALSGSVPPSSRRDRGVISDFARSCVALTLGVFVAIGVGGLSRWESLYIFWTLVLGPGALLLAFMVYGAEVRGKAVARAAAAEAGWVAFISVFTVPEFNQWLLSFYSPGLVLTLTGLLALSAMLLGLLLGDAAWRAFHPAHQSGEK